MDAHRVVAILILALGKLVFVSGDALAFGGTGAFGGGLEWNGNAPKGVANAVAIGLDLNLPFAVAPLAAGANVTGSTDFSGANALEFAALLRWYFLPDLGPGRYEGWFVQVNLGGTLFLTELEAPTWFLGELRGGYRQPMGTNFFIEPYIRMGFPIMVGVGFFVGMRLGSRDVHEPVFALENSPPAPVPPEPELEAVAEVHLWTLNFRPGVSELSGDEMERVHELAETLRDFPQARLRISGHTAYAGTETARFVTSVERVGFVANYLIGQGVVRPYNIVIVGYGAHCPVGDPDTPEGMAANRRVEIAMSPDGGDIECEGVWLPRVGFQADSAQITAEEMLNIHRIADTLREKPQARILVAGHTALAGTERERFSLSLERALNVAVHLVDMGAVHARNVNIVCYGSYRPLGDNETSEGMAGNRRVEVTILEG